MARLERIRGDLEAMAERRGSRRQPGVGSRLVSMLLGAAVGAAGIFLLDPDRGRSRRARLTDQAAALARRGRRRLDRATRLVTATVEGKVEALRHVGPGAPPANDAALVERIETAVYRDPSIPKGAININAENGVVVIRGELPDLETRERLDAAIRHVTGVWGVSDLTHLVGEGSPTAT